MSTFRIARGAALALSAAIAVTTRADAQADARAALLVTPSWVADHLKDPDLVLLHVGDRDEYARAHLPGARLVALDDISVSSRDHDAGLMLELPPAEALREKLQSLGISDRSRIVVYFGKDWVTPSTRVILTLDHAGLGARTSLLDGGMPAWTAEGRPTTADVPRVVAGRLAPLATRRVVVDAAWVRAHLGEKGTRIVDGRAAVFYDGVEQGMGSRKGHIAGAGSVPFTEITDERLRLRSPTELAALFAKAGVAPRDTVVAYCHIGQQATAVVFAARSLGHPVLLYDGSFQEWSRRAELPVDNPSARTP